MSKNILTVKCNKDIKYDDWDNICRFIQNQVGEEYHVIGLLKGIELECITEEDKIFVIDGDTYTYKNIKEAIEGYKNSLELASEVEDQPEKTSEETKEDNEDNKEDAK